MDSFGKDLENCCRLCGSDSNNGIIIYSSEGMGMCLEEKIIQCLRIEVTEKDMLPKRICCTCKTKLEDCYSFASHAIKVQQTFQLLVHMKLNKLEFPVGQDDIKFNIIEETKEVKHCTSENFDPGSTSNSKHVSDKASHNADESCTLNECFINKSLKTSDHKRCSPNQRATQINQVDNTNNSKVEGRNQTNLQGAIEDKLSETEDHKLNEKDAEEIEVEEEDEELEAEELDEQEDYEDGEGVENDKSVQEEWKAHWGIKCNECEQLFPYKSVFDEHYRTSYEKKPVYTCSYCNKTMEKYSTFRSHCYRHVTEGRYRCEFCQKGFSLRSMLHVHTLAKHTAVKPYICEECGKGFVTRPGLNIHLKKHRSDEKSEYPCSECGKILHTRGGLTAHQNVHKLGRRFMCDVCGKTFTQKVNMQQHVKHHTGERPFACEKCGKCFAEKSHLNRHYSFHSENRPYQCNVCHKLYKTERCLKVHSMVHAAARPYVCTYCNKGFLSTTKLKQHYNIHTGERPYACKFCERTFTNYPNWLKHTRRRHKTDPRGGSMRPIPGGNTHLEITQQVELQPTQQVVCQIPLQPSQEQQLHLQTVQVIQEQQGPERITPQVPHNISIACSSNSSAMTAMTYSHSMQPMMQATLPLGQVYPDHMMMHLQHHHHMLPL